MNGPVITTDLYSARTDELMKLAEERLITANTTAARAQAKEVAESIQAAYVRGLQDGFAQAAWASECHCHKEAGDNPRCDRHAPTSPMNDDQVLITQLRGIANRIGGTPVQSEDANTVRRAIDRIEHLCFNTELEKATGRLLAKFILAVEALEKYGTHAPECHRHDRVNGSCWCGFDVQLSALKSVTRGGS